MSYSVIQEHYLDGKLDGVREILIPNGRKSRGFYRHGKLNGTLTVWHPHGNICLQECYWDGKQEGKSQSRREDGTCWGISFFENDWRNGERMHYKNRELYKYEFYRRGICIDEHFTSSKKAVFLSLKHKLYIQSIDYKGLVSNFLISDLSGI